MTLDELQALAERIRTEIEKAVHGQTEVVDMVLTALFARGHVLLEGPPGTAKTLLAQSTAKAMKLDFGRIQFTPDLMPGDVLGVNIFDFSTSQFKLTRGPVFTDILLADEINRAPPKTQASLLQVMNERVVTIDGTDHQMGPDFFVIATQNPIEQQGTYPLPEAQLDRFLFKLDRSISPKRRRRWRSCAATRPSRWTSHARQTRRIAACAVGPEEITGGRALVDGIRLDETILAYVLKIVRATRSDADIQHGASTRAADAICRRGPRGGGAGRAGLRDPRRRAAPRRARALRHRHGARPFRRDRGADRPSDVLAHDSWASIEAPQADASQPRAFLADRRWRFTVLSVPADRRWPDVTPQAADGGRALAGAGCRCSRWTSLIGPGKRAVTPVAGACGPDRRCSPARRPPGSTLAIRTPAAAWPGAHRAAWIALPDGHAQDPEESTLTPESREAALAIPIRAQAGAAHGRSGHDLAELAQPTFGTPSSSRRRYKT